MKPANTTTSRRILLQIALFCVSLTVALGLCEITLRLMKPSEVNRKYYIWPPNYKVVFKPYTEIMPGISGDSNFTSNSLGIRADELNPTQTIRVMAIGGSTTQCSYLDQRETWTHLLQESLNQKTGPGRVWVGNAGVSGTTTGNHVTAVEYLPFHEMKINIVLLLMGVNDLSFRLSHDKEYDPQAPENQETKEELIARTFRGTSTIYQEDSMIKRLALWQLIRKSKQFLLKEHTEDIDGKIYNTWRDNRRRATEIRDQLPNLDSALEEYTVNVNRIIDLSREKSLRPILMTQPSIWRADLPQNLVNLLWLGGVGDFQKGPGQPYYSISALENGIKRYNDLLLRICAERGVECIDLASMIEKDGSVFYDDVHFNESGARKIAEAVSRYLLARDPFLPEKAALNP